ncbi:MAG: hypothetical protein V3T30_02575 [Thermodesulfobacteriota bacterium]
MIKIVYKKSTGEHFHEDEVGKRTKITALPPQASIKAVKARAKAMGLKVNRRPVN